ncbi:hypothetical protein F4780DRAFT_186911 [Xylariomycetidae sp. FL0641]|nr:hypothetical protein F4780DRAFT_186911 [Xylariomycetidae sp. FL0641]
MEPVGAVLAVVSLAVQIGECALRVQKFIDTLSQSAGEVSRLRHLAESLHLITDGIRQVFDPNQAPRAWPSATSQCIKTSLSTCQHTISQIEAILAETMPSVDSHNLLARRRCQLRMAMKKRRIDELEKQLQGALIILHMTLTVHREARQQYPSPSHSISDNGTSLSSPLTIAPMGSIPPYPIIGPESLGDNQRQSALRPSPPKRQRHYVISTRSIESRMNSWFGTLKKSDKVTESLRPMVARPDGIQRPSVVDTSWEYNWSIVAPLLSWCFEIQLSYSSRTSWRFQFAPTHIMHPTTEREIRKVLYHRDTMGFRNLLAERAMTLNSLDRRGQTLLFLAQLYQDDEAVKCLIVEGCSIKTENIRNCASWKSLDEALFRSLCAGVDLAECRADTIFPDVTNPPSVARYQWYITESLISTCLVPSTYYGSRLYVEAREWGKLVDIISTHQTLPADSVARVTERPIWETWLAESVRHRANLHFIDAKGHTILGKWVHTYHPVNSQEIIRQWLHLLERNGVDRRTYLETEIKLFRHFRLSSNWTKSSLRRRNVELRASDHGLACSVSWCQEFPGPAEQLLEEFVDLGDDQDFSPLLRYSIPMERDWDRFWPFSYNVSSDCQAQHAHCLRCSQYNARVQRRNEIWRCRNNQWREQHGVSVLDLSGVPGSWVH